MSFALSSSLAAAALASSSQKASAVLATTLASLLSRVRWSRSISSTRRSLLSEAAMPRRTWLSTDILHSWRIFAASFCAASRTSRCNLVSSRRRSWWAASRSSPNKSERASATARPTASTSSRRSRGCRSSTLRKESWTFFKRLRSSPCLRSAATAIAWLSCSTASACERESPLTASSNLLSRETTSSSTCAERQRSATTSVASARDVRASAE
mmetsp:Transcript_13890/g.33137  ORF Transcript_13890/g.33137 Transcript_13890/m.33137 type:complete len:213 (-) Transcript_13890:197-835(-)